MSNAGRPTDYTEDLAASFCSEIAMGNSLRAVVKMEEMPSHQTIYNWFANFPEFIEQYARAKQDSADSDPSNIHRVCGLDGVVLRMNFAR